MKRVLALFWRGHKGAKKELRCCRSSFFMVTRARIELALQPWKGRVLTSWPSGLVAATGFEPVTLRVWTACSSQLSYAAKSFATIRRKLLYYIGAAFVNSFLKYFSPKSAFYSFALQNRSKEGLWAIYSVNKANSGLCEEKLRPRKKEPKRKKGSGTTPYIIYIV